MTVAVKRLLRILEAITNHVQVSVAKTLSSTIGPTILIRNDRSEYEMGPACVVFFKTDRGQEYKLVVEVGISQTHDSLLVKARKWTLDKKCKIVLLLAFYESERYYYCESQDHCQFGQLAFHPNTWLDEISEGFIEVVRKDPNSEDTDAQTNMKYAFIKNGRDKSSSIPRAVGDMRLAEFIPRESLGTDAAADHVVDFFNCGDFTCIVRDPRAATAVNRFEKAVQRIA
ncbi:uncharacterized protein V1513DRAFT_461158 [Lipomyces chichibuensis]|uniref:uncharacterized protein n=1 Tax=Lipomyces chichibuensis TaxID=1546026 RepID=UPI0033436BD6